ncbi:MAG: hypothetical protein KZQ81_18805 [Candidatus Thiodiazotropha sp. (ex Rostrolucina anterorostrata)]|nr:hypothetical protein [Candidatus Thiodiazotropha sp. (ex Rostrolucina anterorostrata)]
MTRISDDQLDRLKQEVSLQRLTEGMGISLKCHGADLIGPCPFHDDHEPSLMISPKKNLWHCLGACQTGGSMIDGVMKAERVSFRHTVELLQTEHYPALAAGANPEELARLLALLCDSLAASVISQRPGRREPRCTKRRPKNYQRMTKPRAEMQECPHRSKYHAERP